MRRSVAACKSPSIYRRFEGADRGQLNPVDRVKLSILSAITYYERRLVQKINDNKIVL